MFGLAKPDFSALLPANGVGGVRTPALTPSRFLGALALLACMAPGNALAQQDPIELRRADWLPSARSAGMAGASVGLADDESALAQNPAGIGRVEGSKSPGALRGFQAPNLTLTGDDNGFALLERLPTGVKNTADLRNLVLQARADGASHGRVTLFPFVTLWRFQLGFIFDQSLSTVLTKLPAARESVFAPGSGASVDTLVELEAHRSSGVAAGISAPYKDTGLSVGGNVRFLSHSDLRQSLEANDGVLGASSEAASRAAVKTTSLAFDGGLLLKRMAKGFRLGAGIAVRDIGDTRKKSGKETLATRTMSGDVGASVSRSFGSRMTLQTAIDAVSIGDRSLKLRDRFRFGLEGAYGPDAANSPFSVRLGHDLRTFSAGVSANLVFFRLDFARTGALVRGTEAGTQSLQGRYLGRLTVDLRM